MRISSREKIKPFKNKSLDSKSIISSDYVFLKNGNVKRKRNKNSYYEAFLEKRRMAAEFAQSKRCYSTVSTKITYANKKNRICGLQDIINMNNLKHNLPGKATPIIDNTNNINNKDNYIFFQNNINSLSHPEFDEIKHLTNKSNAINDNSNNLSPPYELENNENEETSKFGKKDRIIDTNQSRKIEIMQLKKVEMNNNNIINNYNKIKNNNTYIKKRPIRDENILIATLRQNKNTELNKINNNQVETSISFRNDLNNNNKDKNNNINNIIENYNSNDFSIKYNEQNKKDINRYIDTNNNEENDNNINYFNNINDKIQNNTNEFKNKRIEINKNNETDPNEISNEAIEETNIIKDYIDDNNEKNNLSNNNNIEQNNSKVINYDNKIKNSFDGEYENNKNIKDYKEIIKENKSFDVKQNYLNIPKWNFSSKEGDKEKLKLKETNENNGDIIFKNYNNKNKKNINLNIFNKEINKPSVKNIIPPINENKLSKKDKSIINDNINNASNNIKENKNIFSLMINKDIEKLNKIKNIPHRNNDKVNYFDEINNLINQIKGKRNNIKNDFINKTNENREKLLLLENQKKELKMFQSQINTALNYSKQRINFENEKELDEQEKIKLNKNNINNNFKNNVESLDSKRKSNNNNNANKFKISISTRMQSLLNKLKKEKISNNVAEFEDNSHVIEDNKNIFNKNVIESINNFIKDENLNNNHVNNINSNNHSNNFILLQNYYNNENNNKKYKNSKTFYNKNFISYNDIDYSVDRNFLSNRESDEVFYTNINRNDINELDEKIFKLIKNNNTRLSKSRPNINLNLSKPDINTFENDNYKYKISSSNSRGFDKSLDNGPFLKSHTYLDKVKQDLKIKNNDIDLYKSRSKRNSDYSSFLIMNNNNINSLNNYEINIMPVNNIKSIFK